MCDNRSKDSIHNDEHTHIQDQESKNEKNKTQEFYKICKDFIVDILTSFPEFKNTLHNGFIHLLQANYENYENYENEETHAIYTHCKEVFPKYFFDILYQNEDVFINNETLFLLPNIDFTFIWKQNVSEHTKGVIWKYLQLILFTLISDVKDGSAFGDTAKLFEAINEDEFKNKLEETLESMSAFFDNTSSNNTGETDADTDKETGNGEKPSTPSFTMDGSSINLDSLPNPQDIHNHINGMLDGKLGNLAREIAEETAQELNIDMEGASSVQDVFKKLFKNPGKLMSIVKNVGNKLESKLKSGDLSESDLIKETTEMMSRMKDMPGMGNIHKMMREMGVNMPIPGGGKNTKVNMGAFQAHMNTNLRNAQMKERMRQKLEQRQAQAQGQANTSVDCFSPENQNQNRTTTTTHDEDTQPHSHPHPQSHPHPIKYTKGEAPEKSQRVKKTEEQHFDIDDDTNKETNTVTKSNDKKKKKRKNKK
jgi:hypothetical protein